MNSLLTKIAEEGLKELLKQLAIHSAFTAAGTLAVLGATKMGLKMFEDDEEGAAQVAQAATMVVQQAEEPPAVQVVMNVNSNNAYQTEPSEEIEQPYSFVMEVPQPEEEDAEGDPGSEEVEEENDEEAGTDGST